MALPKIRVRSKTTGLETVIAESALKHFPGYERVEDVPASTLPPAAAVERPKTTSRAAAKNDEE